MKSWNLELQLNVCIGVDVEGVAAVEDELDPIPNRFWIMLGTNEVEAVEVVAVVVFVEELLVAPIPNKVCDQAGAETPSITIATTSHFPLRIFSPFSRTEDLRVTGTRFAEWWRTITIASNVSRPSFGGAAVLWIA
jgi:hypothetical protein